MKRLLKASLVLVGMVIMGAATALPAHAQSEGGKVMVSTTRKNGVVTNWNCGCPKNGETNAFVVDMNKLMMKMNEREMQQFMQLLNEFERVNGMRIQGGTKVENHQTTSDAVKATSVGPMKGIGQQLCDFLKRFL